MEKIIVVKGDTVIRFTEKELGEIWHMMGNSMSDGYWLEHHSLYSPAICKNAYKKFEDLINSKK